MKKLKMIESIYNLFDFGIYVEMVQNAKKMQIEMEPKIFLRHLLMGKGYKKITPPQLETVLKKERLESIVIDLREKKSFTKGHIPDAILHPFDDFIGDILMQGGYEEYKKKTIILVCDTGHKSRVAASILIEEGFLNLMSLKQGMRRWNRWENLRLKCPKNSNLWGYLCGSLLG